MSKNYKGVGVALTTAALMTFTAACGGDGGGGGGGGDEFVIGGFGALTGPVAGWGEAQRNGAELAVEEINESGELDMDLKMVYEDDACDPAGAQAVFRRLVDREAVDALMGGACSASALAMAELADGDGVPYLSPTATTREMHEPPLDFVFSTQVDATTEAQELVRMALETYQPDTVGFMYNSNDYGIAAVESAKAALAEQAPDVEIAPDAGFPEGTSEFDSGLIKLRDAGPDVVFAVGVGSDLGPMIRSARQLGIDAELVGFSSLFTTETIRTAGPLLDNVTGFFYTPVRLASDSEDAEAAELATSYHEKYGEWPDGLALEGYVGVMTLAEAIKSLDGEEPTAENLVEALEGLEDFQATTAWPSITFGPDDRAGATEGVLMKLLPGREEKTSLWGNFEIVATG
jgi:branched-chain amino acid transport system substrate-binding protein